jgi:hypothetical protein|tara:strand:+ start:195 stop:419 length:225 start_codon:yes stop_codon:yes gene_type:complete
MRAIRGKNKVLSLLSRDEATLFNKIDLNNFLDINTLDERTNHIAEELYKRNVINKIRKENKVGYEIYPQKDTLK